MYNPIGPSKTAMLAGMALLCCWTARQPIAAQQRPAASVTLTFRFILGSAEDHNMAVKVFVFNEEFLTVRPGETVSKDYRYTDDSLSLRYEYTDTLNPEDTRHRIQTNGLRFSLSGNREEVFTIPKPPMHPSGFAQVVFLNEFTQDNNAPRRVRVRLQDLTGREGDAGGFNKTPQGAADPKPSVLTESAAYRIPAGPYRMRVLDADTDQELRAYEEWYFPAALAPYTIALNRDFHKAAGSALRRPGPVQVDAALTVEFTKPMIKPLVEWYIKLYQADNPAAAVPVLLTWEADDKTLRIKPAQDLLPLSAYCLAIENLNARDRSGNSLAWALREEFTTAETLAALPAAANVRYDGEFKMLRWEGVRGADGYELRVFLPQDTHKHDLGKAESRDMGAFEYHWTYPGIEYLIIPYKLINGNSALKAYSHEALNAGRRIIEFETVREEPRKPARMSFGVRLDADSGDRIRNTLFGVIESLGFVGERDRGTYTIEGTVSTLEEEQSGIYFVRSGIHLRVVDAEGATLFTYSENYPRQGANNWPAAYNLAFRRIEADLRTTFKDRFNEFVRKELKR